MAATHRSALLYRPGLHDAATSWHRNEKALAHSEVAAACYDGWGGVLHWIRQAGQHGVLTAASIVYVCPCAAYSYLAAPRAAPVCCVQNEPDHFSPGNKITRQSCSCQHHHQVVVTEQCSCLVHVLGEAQWQQHVAATCPVGSMCRSIACTVLAAWLTRRSRQAAQQHTRLSST
jgi:hypothetical protein